MAALHIFFCAVFLFGLWHIADIVIAAADRYVFKMKEGEKDVGASKRHS